MNELSGDKYSIAFDGSKIDEDVIKTDNKFCVIPREDKKMFLIV